MIWHEYLRTETSIPLLKATMDHLKLKAAKGGNELVRLIWLDLAEKARLRIMEVRNTITDTESGIDK